MLVSEHSTYVEWGESADDSHLWSQYDNDLFLLVTKQLICDILCWNNFDIFLQNAIWALLPPEKWKPSHACKQELLHTKSQAMLANKNKVIVYQDSYSDYKYS